MSDITNRVAQSKLITFDLEDYYPEGERVLLDISQWLYEGIILKEKEFRKQIDEIDWAGFSDKYVALNCSTDAIVPGWAFMLITSRLQPYAKKVVQGDLVELETQLYSEVIRDLDTEPFADKPVIIKGCSNKPVPPNAYVWATEKIQAVASKLMYGEACSSVPIYRRK